MSATAWRGRPLRKLVRRRGVQDRNAPREPKFEMASAGRFDFKYVRRLFLGRLCRFGFLSVDARNLVELRLCDHAAVAVEG